MREKLLSICKEVNSKLSEVPEKSIKIISYANNKI